MKITIVTDTDALANAAADFFIAQSQASIQENGRFAVALSGGNTPRQLYERLAKLDLASRVNWEAVHLFWGDERCVPPDHADSNYRMAMESLRVPIPEKNIHRIQGELPPEEAAARYENQLRDFFGDAPRFDLILLGLGDDGHTASLFPASPALNESTRWAVAVQHTTPPPPGVPRVTLTLPVINNAQDIIFLVAGTGKARRVAEALGKTSRPNELPAQAIRPVHGNLAWLIDKAAAALLPGGQ